MNMYALLLTSHYLNSNQFVHFRPNSNYDILLTRYSEQYLYSPEDIFFYEITCVMQTC